MSDSTLTEREPQPLRKNRDFRLLWASTAASITGSNVSDFAYPILVLWATGSASAAGLVAFAVRLPDLLLQLPAGAWVDRGDRRRTMILCDAGRLAVILGVIAILVTGHLWAPALAALGFIEGCMTVVYRTAERAAVPAIVDPEHIGSAVSQNEAREQAAGLVGQPIAGLLVTLGRPLAFVFTAVTHVASLLTLLRIRRPMQRPVPRGEGEDAPVLPANLLREVGEGIRWMWNESFVRRAVMLIAASNGLFAVITLAVTVQLHDDHQRQFVVGLVAASAGIGGVLGALGAQAVGGRLPLPVVVIVSNLLWAVLLPVLAFTHNPIAIGVLYAGMSLIGAGWSVCVTIYGMQIVPAAMEGRIASVALMVALGLIPFGSLAGGFLLDHVTPSRLFAGAGIAMAVLSLLAAASRAVRAAKWPTFDDDAPPSEDEAPPVESAALANAEAAR